VPTQTFRVRLRFRLNKCLHIDAPERDIVIAGHPARLSTGLADKSISDSPWLIINVRGLPDHASAKRFGEQLRRSCELASATTRLGLDAGTDLPTSGFGAVVKARVREMTGEMLRDNIHGLDVFEDDPMVRFACLSMTGTVRQLPDDFLGLVDQMHGKADALPPRCTDILLLLNYALLRADPVATIVFSISAVEMLGQSHTWSAAQRALLDTLAQDALNKELGTSAERREVSDAIYRGTQRLSLRQGVFRLLSELGIDHLKKKWDAVYSARSSLVHGLAPRPGADYGPQAHETVTLCGHILMSAVAREIPSVTSHFQRFYAP
jgi:hypothetical protein